MHIHYNDSLATPKHKNTSPRSHEIYKFGRPFLGCHYYMPVLNLSDPFPSVDVKKSRNIAFSLYCPSTRTACPWGHEICNFGRFFLGHHYCTISFSELCLGVKKLIFKENIHLYFHAPASVVMKYATYEDTSLVIIFMHLVFLIYDWE